MRAIFELGSHTSYTGLTGAKVSPGRAIFIDAIFGLTVPNARSSSGVLSQYQWSAEGANGFLERSLGNLGVDGTATCGGFCRREPIAEKKIQVLLETAKVLFDDVLKISTTSALAQDDLNFVKGAEVTSNS